MTAAEKKIAVVIIAAGASSRLGSPKQLLPYAGKTLLQHILQVSIDSVANPVVVILGANADEIAKGIDYDAIHVVVNNDWREGMASSIRYGIKALEQVAPDIAGTIIMLCDQPHVTPELLNNLVATYLSNNAPIVASEYNGVLGAPALFQKSIFPELLQLHGDVGARVIIHRYGKDVEAVAFSNGDIDIDTAADYEQLSKEV